MERAGVVLGSCWMDLTLEHVGVVLLQHISSTPPAHLQHFSARRPLRVAGACWLCVNTTPTPLHHHTSTTSTRLRVTLGAAHMTSRDPKVKIRFGNRAKTRFQAGFAILTSFSKANS